MSGSELRQRLAAILAADVAGYSRLMSVDERATVAALDAARAVFRKQIESNQGRVIDMAGDSVLAVFEIATGAVSAAIAIQRELDASASSVPEGRRMRFRIGVHLGDVIEKADGTVYGDGVNIAARLEGLAEPGGITVSESIRIAVKGKVDAGFEDQGEQKVKNIVEPVRAYRVKTDGSAADDRALSMAGIDLSLPDKPSIAVLAFSNLSGDPEQEYFTDGITEDIITALSRFHSLFVVARNSTFTYKGKATDIRTVARELGVRYVVEGSIRRAGNRVRVTAQLIDALSGNHLWAEHYDRVPEDIFVMQDEITQSIVATIAPEIASAERSKARRRRPTSLSAYEMAVRAWADSAAAQKNTDKLLRAQAIREAEEALAIDSASTLALNAFANAKYQDVFFRNTAEPEIAWKEGMNAAQRAIELDPSDSLAYTIKGLLLRQPTQGTDDAVHADREVEALRDLRYAHDLNPNDAYSLVALGFFEAACGNPARGIEYLSRSLRNNPRDPLRFRAFSALSVAHFLAKDYVNGIKWGLNAASEAPNLFNVQFFLALNYVGSGEHAKAKAALETARGLAPEYIQSRLDGFTAFRDPEYRKRVTTFTRVAAGLEDPGAAHALR